MGINVEILGKLLNSFGVEFGDWRWKSVFWILGAILLKTQNVDSGFGKKTMAAGIHYSTNA